MPTYDYRCNACGHTFEAFQSITAELLDACPNCDKHDVTRLIGGGFGVLFKGSGFYETDYKRKRERKTEKSGAGASESGGSDGSEGTGGGNDSSKSSASSPSSSSSSGDGGGSGSSGSE